METTTLTAPGISCDHCKATIEREISTMPGVGRVTVDVPTKTIHVGFDPGSTSVKAIVERLDEEGYPASPR